MGGGVRKHRMMAEIKLRFQEILVEIGLLSKWTVLWIKRKKLKENWRFFIILKLPVLLTSSFFLLYLTLGTYKTMSCSGGSRSEAYIRTHTIDGAFLTTGQHTDNAARNRRKTRTKNIKTKPQLPQTNSSVQKDYLAEPYKENGNSWSAYNYVTPEPWGQTYWCVLPNKILRRI